MKYVGILVFLLGFAPPVQAGEVDGEGIICHKQDGYGKKYLDPIFLENGSVLAVELEKLTIRKRQLGKYRTSNSLVTWRLDIESGGSAKSSLDRETLKLSTVVHVPGTQEEYTYLHFKCESADWIQIEQHMQSRIDKLKEEMEDNNN